MIELYRPQGQIILRGRLTCPAKFMVHLYILKNNSGKYYIGITSLSLEARLARHNNGEVNSTKFYRPWSMIHSEEFQDFESARKREKQIKSWHGGNAFKKLIGSAAGSSNGRTADSGSVYLGSNPSPAALPVKNKFGGVK